MPEQRQTVKIFIASSGELADERKEMVLLLSEINKLYPHLYLEPVKWDTNLASGSYAGRIQDAINPLLDTSDIVVFMFYSKVGIFTFEEFERTRQQGKKAFIYFKTGFSPRNLTEMQGYTDVLQLRDTLERENTSLFIDFDNLEMLENRLRGDLQLYLNQTYPPTHRHYGEADRSNSNKDALYHLIRAIHPQFNHPVTASDIVGCDRNEARKRFWQAFDNIQPRRFQFYFISACPTQMPPSLAERMVFEFLHEELRGSDKGLWIERKTGSERFTINNLPFGRNLDRSKLAFVDYFCDKEPFRSQIGSHVAFTDFLHTGAPRLGYDAVSALFQVREKDWTEYPFLPEYLEWIVQTFGEVHADTPAFLFFFVVYVEQQHHSAKLDAGRQKILQQLMQLVDAPRAQLLVNPQLIPDPDDRHKQHTLTNPDMATALLNKDKALALLPTLGPVLRSDLENWIYDLGETNPQKIDKLIEVLVQTINDKNQLERFRKENKLDMHQVEILLESIYQYDLT